MEGIDRNSIPFKDQNKASFMTQVSIQVKKFFYLFDYYYYYYFVELLGTTYL
jgi:hypothetical protein